MMIGTDDISWNPVTSEAKWESFMNYLLNELKEKYRPMSVVLFTIPVNPDAESPVAGSMNGNVTQWNVMIKNLTTGNLNELRLMDVDSTLRMSDNGSLKKNGIHFITQPGIQWKNDPFQTKVEEMEAELRKMVNSVTRGSADGRVTSHVPQALVPIPALI